MRNSNQPNGFISLGGSTNTGRNFGNQQVQQQQQGFQNNGYGRDDEPVVAWLNIYMAGTTGERKKLGRGIPLRDSNPLERAILNMLFDDEGNEREEGITVEQLKGAMILDVRPANRPDDVFELDLFGALATNEEPETPAPAKPRQLRSKPKSTTE